MGKICKNLVFLLFTGASFALGRDTNSVSSISNVDNSLYALLDKNSSTEAGTVCLDEASCRGDDSSLSKLTESLPKCPKFIIEQQIIRDSRSSLATESPDEICLKNNQALSSHFKTSSELESYLKRNPHFSGLNTASPFSSCLSQGISVPLGLGNSSLAESIRSFPESKKKLAVAEYYSSLKRLQDGVTRSLNNITAIDLMIGKKPLLGGVSCNSFDPLSSSIKEQCSSIKQCSSKVSSASPVSSSLQSSAKDTLLALQAVEAIGREIQKLKGPRARNLRKNKEKIEELRERQKSIQSLYPWIEGEVFQDSYNRNDYANYAKSSEEVKSRMEDQMAGLIKRQLTHTRSKLKERKEDFIKASACIRGKEEHCQDLNIAKVLSQTPAINNDEVFKRERRKELKDKNKSNKLSPEERREYRYLLTEVSEADSLFKSVDCLQTQRREVKEVNKELALGALDVGIVIGTMGLGTAAVAGKLALRMGGALSKTQKMSKAKRFQNLGIFGTDASLSAPYMKEAMNICEDSLNQLEETAATKTNEDCEKLSQGVKHTSDLKSCLLSASLASLPITLPIIGLSGIALAKKLRGTKVSSQAVPSSSAEKAEEVLGTKLSSSQKKAIEEAHLVGQGQVGRDGTPARIGNYTEDQLRRKAEILKQAGLSSSQRRTLMEKGIVGDDLLRRANEELGEALQKIRQSPEELRLKKQGFKREYYRGVDQARELNAVARYLRTINADPKNTHIQYFSDQIDKTISDFEASFRKHNQDNPEFLAERLKLLEDIKREARKRIKDQNVTYDWWANFNLRLPMIAEEPYFIQQILKMRSRKKLIDDLDLNNPTIKARVDTEIAYNRELAQEIKKEIKEKKLAGHHILVKHYEEDFKQLNPKKIISDEGAYTSEKLEEVYSGVSDLSLNFVREGRPHEFDEIGEELGWYNIDNLKTHEEVQELLQTIATTYRQDVDDIRRKVITLQNLPWKDIGDEVDGIDSFVRTQDSFPGEIMFFTTDELGVMAFNKLEDNSHFVGISGSPSTADHQEMQAFQFLAHDLQHIKIAPEVPQKVLERIDNIPNKLDREKAEFALFTYRHEGAYTEKLEEIYSRAETNLSNSERKQLEADTKKSARKMMKRLSHLFFRSDDFQGMLPDSVNANDIKEVERFFTESADVFVDVLLAR